MCGIIGYLGSEPVKEVLLSGLRALAYRGYDSAGIAVLSDGANEFQIERAAGKLEALEEKLATRDLPGHVGIGHTRWATHGRPSLANAHPHCAGSVVVVHNGIIENFRELKASLQAKGCVFHSETDTEVLAHLVCDAMTRLHLDLADAVSAALRQVRGSYAAVFMSTSEPHRIVAARLASPLVVGVCEDAVMVASDIPALLSRTRQVLPLEEGELAVLDRDGVRLKVLATGENITRNCHTIEWSAQSVRRGAYEHFMLKEIYEQPDVLAATLDDCLSATAQESLRTDADLCGISQVTAVAMGTSHHAALILRNYIERIAKVPCNVELASEFRYGEPLVRPDTLLIAISQSGETADTVIAAEEARRRGARVLALTNVEDSSLARIAHARLYTRAGPEIGVASTKAYTTQLAAGYVLAVAMASERGLLNDRDKKLHAQHMLEIPKLVAEVLGNASQGQSIGRLLTSATSALFLGRGCHVATAMEGALKLKELAYIHAEGYAAGEMKHGPIALVDANFFVLFVAPSDRSYDKLVSNAEEVKARDGRIVSIVSKGDHAMRELSEAVCEIPHCSQEVAPILAALPLQLLAYEAARRKGHDVDRPRNLAKSVTVE